MKNNVRIGMSKSAYNCFIKLFNFINIALDFVANTNDLIPVVLCVILIGDNF